MSFLFSDLLDDDVVDERDGVGKEQSSGKKKTGDGKGKGVKRTKKEVGSGRRGKGEGRVAGRFGSGARRPPPLKKKPDDKCVMNNFLFSLLISVLHVTKCSEFCL